MVFVIVNGVFTSFFCRHVHMHRGGEMASPTCLLTEERGVRMLLRKPTFACLVLALQIDWASCLLNEPLPDLYYVIRVCRL